MSDDSNELPNNDPPLADKKGDLSNAANLNAACFRCRGFR
jgi:hypothetical protein